MKVFIQLENGSVFEGKSFGAPIQTTAGLFTANGAMIGYEEVMTDPGNYGKFLVMTYPLIGGYGTNFEDMEADRPTIQALICRDAMSHATNFRKEMDLEEFLLYYEIMGIKGVDTRSLSKELQTQGDMRGVVGSRLLTPSQMEELFQDIEIPNLEEISTKETVELEGEKGNIGILDLGMKKSLLQYVADKGYKATIYSAGISSKEILEGEHNVVLVSSGPGKATDYPEIIETIRSLKETTPVIGVGMGAQMIGLALGGTLLPLETPHCTASHPVWSVDKERVYMTSQNHNYTIKEEKLLGKITYVSDVDKSVEGFENLKANRYGFLFDPLGKPGADDLSDVFTTLLEKLA